MARPLRLELTGGLYHVMNRGNEQRDIFRDDEDRLSFLAMLEQETLRCNWRLHDYALMANHFHLVIETPEANLSKGMHRLQSRYAQWFNWRHSRCGHLFQGRFKAIIAEEESYLMELSRYVVLNPVRAGLVEHPEKYRWSSYRAKIGYEPIPAWIETRGLERFGGPRREAQRRYRAFVEEKVASDYTIEERIVGQIFLGGTAFIGRMQELIDSEERSSEHPRVQREIGRPPLKAIREAVTETMAVSNEELRNRRGDLSRMVYAKLGWWEGLRPLREIAADLGLRSLGHVSSLVKRCALESERDPELRALLETCVERARRSAPPLPEHYLSFRNQYLMSYRSP